MKTNTDKLSPEILELRRRVEEKANIVPMTPTDFSRLSALVMEKTGDLLSATTLKRIWSYIQGAETVRLATLNILSNYLGYERWNDFVSEVNNEGQSDYLLNKSIRADELEVGDIIALEWLPNRRIEVRYKGAELFEVIKAENSKVSVGDTFECGFMLLNEPLYVTNLVHEGEVPVAFVMGNKDGLTKVEKL